ncbi:TonB-dependent receptor [Hyphococcus lacteus]|uniref:TonB-dependent receptor n=1 Tax=Hyphococcus lacteus TaxID=3143536 RepID=A0ABV3YZF8_9PROT
MKKKLLSGVTLAGVYGFAGLVGGLGQASAADEIVVTAQKREERLQDVPISITALSGEELDGQPVGGVSDALRVVPGVSISSTPQGGATQLTIRGVASGEATLNGASTAAYYIDSVPFGLVKSAILPDTNAYDMQRIEVLRGPQGTLYGANALNGVVRLITNDADPEAFDLKMRTGLATTKDGQESYRGDVAVNIPLIEDKVAIRVVAGFENAGGWIDQPNRPAEDVNDSRSRNIRVKLNAHPTDELSIGLSAWVSRIDQDTASYGDDDRNQSSPIPLPQSLDYDAYSMNIGYELPGVSISSATSYLEFSNSSQRDYTAFGDGITLYSDFGSSVFTEELLVNSTNESNWRWSAGAFYRDASDVLYQTLPAFIPAPINNRDASRSYAVFGELTRVMFDGQVELTGGLRYFHDKVSQIERTPSSGDPTQILAMRTEKFDALTPRVVVNWLPNDDLTLYASYSQGFRSGFNQSPSIIRSAPGIAPVEADRLSNYEIGTKGSLLDGALSFNMAAYYIDWKDIHQNLNVDLSGVIFAATVNGPSASGFGVDLGLTAHPAEGFNIGGTFSWNDLTLQDSIITQTASGPVTIYDEGSRLAFSPEYTVGGFLDYTTSIGGGYEAQLSGSVNYRSEITSRLLAGGASALFVSDDPLIARARASIISPDNWTLSLYAENISDWNGVIQPPTDGSRHFRLRPRTIGVQFEFHL